MAETAEFVCPASECRKNFSTKFSLLRHIYTHSGLKNHVCPECGKAFSLPQFLEEHMYTHTMEKPFVCGVDGCTSSFRQRAKLCLHRSTHASYKKKIYRKKVSKKATRQMDRDFKGDEDPELRNREHLDYLSGNSPYFSKALTLLEYTKGSFFCKCDECSSPPLVLPYLTTPLSAANLSPAFMFPGCDFMASATPKLILGEHGAAGTINSAHL